MNIQQLETFLKTQPGPKMLVEAMKLIGIKEVIGAANNPVILEWAKECGIKEYNADAIPWCGLFMAVVAKRAGKTAPPNPLYALNWATFGNPVENPMLGDVLTFKRFDAQGKLIGGHVGLYVGETATTFFVLGGNQGDKVSIVEIAKKRLNKARRPVYSVAVPDNVKVITVASTGTVSTNEA